MPKPTPPLVSGALPGLGHALEFRADRTALVRRGFEEHGNCFAIKLANQNVAILIGPDNQRFFFMETDKALGIQEPYRFLRAMFNRGQYPIGGDEQTVWMTASDLQLPFGLVRTSATYRQVLDVGDWDRSTAVLSTGQSGQPSSPHYADMIDLWREGEQHPMLWTRPAVDAEAAATLWLRPRLQTERI